MTLNKEQIFSKAQSGELWAGDLISGHIDSGSKLENRTPINNSVIGYIADGNAKDVNAGKPIGIVGVVLPWNFPAQMFAWKVAPALVAGNSVIVKPAELTSLSAYRMVQLAYEAGIPEGALSLVCGLGEKVGEALGRHNDVNLDAAVPHILSAAFWNMSENCSCSSRLLVHSNIKDTLLSKLKTSLADWKLGNHMKEEISFGPILAVTTFNSEEEAIALANKTQYGLAASFYSQNAKRTMRVAQAIKAGTVSINGFIEGDITTPFGGLKQSGFGEKDNGIEVFDQYMQTKFICM